MKTVNADYVLSLEERIKFLEARQSKIIEVLEHLKNVKADKIMLRNDRDLKLST